MEMKGAINMVVAIVALSIIAVMLSVLVPAFAQQGTSGGQGTSGAGNWNLGPGNTANLKLPNGKNVFISNEGQVPVSLIVVMGNGKPSQATITITSDGKSGTPSNLLIRGNDLTVIDNGDFNIINVEGENNNGFQNGEHGKMVMDTDAQGNSGADGNDITATGDFNEQVMKGSYNSLYLEGNNEQFVFTSVNGGSIDISMDASLDSSEPSILFGPSGTQKPTFIYNRGTGGLLFVSGNWIT